MTTTTAPAPAPTAAPGGGTPDEEKKVAVGAVALATALGGPVGGVVMALAIGIERAFGKAGWDKPSWGGGEKLTPEQIQQRHDEAVRLAREYVEGAREAAARRAEALKEHRQRMKDYVEGGRQGPKPERPEMRNPREFAGDLWGASKSWYTLFDDKMAKGNEKITGTYPAIGQFFKDLWNFVTGFVEGARDGWQQYQDQKNTGQSDPNPVPDPQPLPPPGGQEQAEAPRPEPGPQPEDEDRGPVKVPASVPPPQPTTGPVITGPGPIPLNPTPAGPGEGTAEGEPMATDSAALPAGGQSRHMGPQGETNLDLLHQAFAPAAPVLTSISEQVDTLKNQAMLVSARVDSIAELCALYGAPAAVFQMMAEARRLTAVVDTGLADIDLHNEVARELTDEALIGLLPAQDDLETTRREQASGDLYNRAGH